MTDSPMSASPAPQSRSPVRSTRGSWALRTIPILLFLAAFTMIVWLLTIPEVRDGAGYGDTDDYTRLLRVRTLLDGGDWFDGSVPRSNWPDGDELHWTRPMDVVLLVGAVSAAPFIGAEAGLHQTAILIPPLLLLATFLVMAWGGTALVGRLAWAVIPVFLLTQPAVLLYGRPGRPDHHALILLCFALGLGFFLRGLRQPAVRRWAVGLGVSAGVGMWVSPEFLLPLGLFLLGGLVAWVVDGRERARFQLAWSACTTGTMVLALAVERGPGLLAVEYDRISVVHVTVGLLATAVAWVCTRVERSRELDPRGRMWRGAGGGALALLAMAALFPPFFGGPMVEVTDEIVRSWLDRVGELQPILLPVDLRSAGLLVINAGAALISIPVLAAIAVRGEEGSRPSGFLAAALGVCLILAVLQFRWTTYVQLLAAASVAMVVHATGRGSQRAAPGIRRFLVAVGMIVGPGIAGGVLVGLNPGGEGGGPAPLGATRCHDEAVAAFLARDPRWRDAPRTVAAHMDLGPVILYRTRHRVWATPYHRNAGGIRKVYDLFAETDPDLALERARSTRPDLLVVCPSRDEAVFPLVSEGDTTLFGHLATGSPPPWLDPVPLPEGLESVRMFRTELSREMDGAPRGATRGIPPGSVRPG